MIRTLLADDSELMRKAIVKLLKTDSEIQLLGEAGTFKEAIELATKLRPQVIVLDIHMTDSLEVTALLVKSSFRYMSIVGMSLSDDADTRAIADSFGAVALVDKMELADVLIPAIKEHSRAYWHWQQ